MSAKCALTRWRNTEKRTINSQVGDVQVVPSADRVCRTVLGTIVRMVIQSAHRVYTGRMHNSRLHTGRSGTLRPHSGLASSSNAQVAATLPPFGCIRHCSFQIWFSKGCQIKVITPSKQMPLSELLNFYELCKVEWHRRLPSLNAEIECRDRLARAWIPCDLHALWLAVWLATDS